MKTCGIYKIQSIINPERIYIGSAIDLRQRWRVHLHQLKKNKHHSKKLQRHYNKYGESDLVFIIIEPCFPEFLIIREQYYIDNNLSYFNNCKNAGSPLGVKHSKEENKRNSERLKGRIFSDETRKRISEAKTGIPLSQEHKDKLSKIKKGKNIGRFVSEETRKKISDANRIRVISEETRMKMKNRIPYYKGLKLSDEHRRKMSESAKEIWRLRKLANLKIV